MWERKTQANGDLYAPPTLVARMFFSHSLPIQYILCITPPEQSRITDEDNNISNEKHCKDAKWYTDRYSTSLPVDASMSRNSSTKVLTSFAALALLTHVRKGRVNLINPANSKMTGGKFLKDTELDKFRKQLAHRYPCLSVCQNAVLFYPAVAKKMTQKQIFHKHITFSLLGFCQQLS